MAIATIYLCQKPVDGKILCAITGQEKIKVKSKRDESFGEKLSPIKSKTFKVVGEALKIRLESYAIALEYLVKEEFNEGDRCFLWGFDKELIDKINQCTAESMINELTSDDDETPNIIKRLYKAKSELNTRIGYQNPSNKNRFVDEARKLIGERDSKIPKWEDALTKAREKAKDLANATNN